MFYAASLGLRPVALASLALSTVGLVTGTTLSHYHQMPLVFETNDAVRKEHLGPPWPQHLGGD